MEPITGSVFLAGALLSCVLPISLLIAFATFFTKQARKLPPNATPAPTAGSGAHATGADAAAHGGTLADV